MEERSVVSLLWEGPLVFGEPDIDSPSEAMPPDRSGVYAWTIPTDDARLVSYVGQAENLRKQLLEHGYAIMGGRRGLFDPRKLASGSELAAIYEADHLTGNWDYVARFEDLSPVAVANLQCYEMLWAELNGGRSFRKCVESALISAARVDPAGSGRVLQRSVVPVGDFTTVPLLVESTFPPKLGIPAFEGTIEYGQSNVSRGG